MKMDKRLLLLHFLVLVFTFAEALSNRPKGVQPQLVSLYQERQEFECLDGSKKISFEQVNDDYCDCDDGSDEPGTSACSNGHFYCPNVGYKSEIHPSSHVNDNICDCCDGSDEWASGATCKNVCQEMGEQFREEEKAMRVIQEAGHTKRVELAKAGAKYLEELKAQVEKQKVELDELTPLKTNLETKKNDLEELERQAKDKYTNEWNALREKHRIETENKLFDELDVNNDSKIELSELQTFSQEKYGDADLEALKTFFGDILEMDIELFRAAVEKVKEYLKKLKDAAANKTEKPEDNPEASITNSPPEAESEEPFDDMDESHEEEDSDNNDKEEELHESDDVPMPDYDEATKSIINEADQARREFEEILKKVSDIENNIRNSENVFNAEYATDHSWATLKGKCAELSTTQYVYRLCLFDRALQKSLDGHSEINLGYWGSWAGSEDDKYSAQLYDKGQSCWNGPERSTRVDIQCGADLQLVEASEPSKCEYRFLLKSPTACSNPADNVAHQEL